MATKATERQAHGGKGARADLASRRADGTLTDVVQAALLDAILAGQYQPGEKLPITAIARESKVSLSVMREALTRLTVDGLVKSEAMQGFSVMDTSVKDLNEIAALLKLLAGTAIQASVTNGGPEWEASLLAAHHLFKRAVNSKAGGAQRSVEVDDAHYAFVGALTSACGNERQIVLLQSLFRSMRLYHRMSINALRHEAVDRVESYWEITQAAINGDASATVKLMIDDIDSAVSACRDHLMASGKA